MLCRHSLCAHSLRCSVGVSLPCFGLRRATCRRRRRCHLRHLPLFVVVDAHLAQVSWYYIILLLFSSTSFCFGPHDCRIGLGWTGQMDRRRLGQFGQFPGTDWANRLALLFLLLLLLFLLLSELLNTCTPSSARSVCQHLYTYFVFAWTIQNLTNCQLLFWRHRDERRMRLKEMRWKLWETIVKHKVPEITKCLGQ